jgi:tetratricopeptide (TPR) repeat protein
MRLKAFEAVVLLCASTIGLSCGATNQGAGQAVGVGTPSAADQAWAAYNKRDHAGAIEWADRCINESLGRATREQEQLETTKAPLPPLGPASRQEKKVIFARVALNDAATCLYIKGRSLEATGRKEEAMEAYRDASKLTYARCWDPKGWFWSPSEGSLDRLRMLR